MAPCRTALHRLAWVFSTLLLLSAAHAAEEDAALSRAARSVERARRILQPRRTPAEILAVLDAAATSLEAVVAPAAPTLRPVSADAGESESARIGEENRRRLKAWRRAREAHERRAERVRARWVRVLSEALVIRRTEGGSLLNEHDAVNRRALALLIESGREDAARAIITALEEEWLRAPRLEVERPMALHALEEIHRMRSPQAFDWLRKTFVGKEGVLRPSMPTNHLSKPSELDLNPHDVPVHALEAIARHERMPGRLRYAVVRDLVRAYAPLERGAASGRDVARWVRVQSAVLLATWRQAGGPTDEAGDALGSMAALAAWFRAHADVGGPPWTD